MKNKERTSNCIISNRSCICGVQRRFHEICKVNKCYLHTSYKNTSSNQKQDNFSYIISRLECIQHITWKTLQGLRTNKKEGNLQPTNGWVFSCYTYTILMLFDIFLVLSYYICANKKSVIVSLRSKKSKVHITKNFQTLFDLSIYQLFIWLVHIGNQLLYLY